MGDIRNRASVTDEVAGFRSREVLVEDAVEAPRFILVPVYGVLDLLGRVPVEVVRLALWESSRKPRPLHREGSSQTYLHWPDTRIHEVHPVVHLVALPAALGEADQVLGIVLLDEVLHDAPRLEQPDRLAIVECVRQRGNAAVGVDVEKPGLFLHVLRHLDFVGRVREAVRGWDGSVKRWQWAREGEGRGWREVPELLQDDGDFDAIGGAGCVEVDVGGLFVEDNGHSGGARDLWDVRGELHETMGHRARVERVLGGICRTVYEPKVMPPCCVTSG